MSKSIELSDFQKRFMAKGTGQTLFTEREFEESLAQAKAEIMAVAIDTTKQAILIEREACAEIAHNMEKERESGGDDYKSPIAEAILNRIPSQRQ
jgi:hypothetical protein